MRILITGAGGFVGSALVEMLRRRGDEVIAAGRRDVGEIGPETDWRPLLTGVETVIHLANRAHVMKETGTDPEALFHRINVEGSTGLAEQAAAAGVRRMVFVSSIKANGEETRAEAYTNASRPAPEDAYGRSKWEAEQRLGVLATRTGLELVVARPPLIYGPRVKGNLRSLMNVVAKGVPLPLASVQNRRSLIGLGNFCDALALMARHPAAPGTWLVKDGEDLSTPELVRRMARALGRSPRLLPFPPALLRLAGRLTGRSAAIGRVLGSLQVDDSATRAALGWTPPMSVDDGLAAMAAEP